MFRQSVPAGDEPVSTEGMARPRGFEPPTSTSGGWRSIQLSYGRIVAWILSSCVPTETVELAVTDRFRDVASIDLFGGLQICDGASELEDAMVGTR